MTALAAIDLCLSLMRADSEAEVIELLTTAGYWDDPDSWRLFNDNENNFSTIGNQQSEAVAAFVEKITNSVDARLVNACRLAGVDPEGDEAPQSMQEAVARFVEQKAHPNPNSGRISDWPDERATKEGRLLTVAATGASATNGQPCLSVADQGEGQRPDAFPRTFLSLQSNNKLRIPFVQGKYNMGGTGALRFSKLQLIVSRRNPNLLDSDASDRDKEWGFTIVRREPPRGKARNSVYTYLAPVSVSGEQLKGVLSFSADALPIFPEANKDVRNAYARDSEYGSLIKLYEYTWQGTRSNIVMSSDGLMRRLDMGLPELALPVRIFECRPNYNGHYASFATNILGIVARLDRDRLSNLEEGEPIGGVIALGDGKQIKLRVYVFESDEKAKQYRNWRHSVVFGVNGQMHAAFTRDFFKRDKVGMGYLADSLLVYVDCSAIDGLSRENLFMNSRDRLQDGPLARELEQKIESFLHNEPTLKEIRLKRRQEAVKEKLADDKPLGDMLQNLLKSNPTLSALFLHGTALSTPFPPSAQGGSGTKKGTADAFHGKRFPSYFRFKDHADGEPLERKARLDVRTRIGFATDAEDGYFVRDVDPGAWNVKRRVGDDYVDATGWITTGPKDGIAQLWFDSLPEDTAIGDTIEYLIEVTDPSRIDAFECRLVLTIEHGGGNSGGGGHSRSLNNNSGKGSDGGSEGQLGMPNIVPIRENDWELNGYDEQTALIVKDSGTSDADAPPVYDFYVNIDNKFLRIAEKEKTANADLLQKQFMYGLVLVGLALLQPHHGPKKESDDQAEHETVDAYVARTTRALGPVLLPLIQAIGSLDDE